MKDQGIRIASRGLWDPTTDNYASTSFTNVSVIFRIFSVPPTLIYSQSLFNLFYPDYAFLQCAHICFIYGLNRIDRDLRYIDFSLLVEKLSMAS